MSRLSTLQDAATVVAVASLLAGAVVVLAPWAVPRGIATGTASSLGAARGVVLVLAVVAGLLGARTLLAMSGERDPDGRPPSERRLGRRRPPDARVAGWRVDEALARVTAADPDRHPSQRVHDVQTVRQRLRDAAVRTLSSSHDVSRDRAAEMVDDGTWTEDPRAAAFLGSAAAPAPPLRIRIRDWASGESTERSVEHAADAIAATADVDREGVTA